MSFAKTELLWFLVIVPLLIWFMMIAWRTRQRLIQEFIPRRLVGDLTVGVSQRRQKARMVISVLAVLFIVLAMARPRWGFDWDEATQRGLDIVVAIDASRSMLATDVRPNRLERAKLAALDLMKIAKTDRIGLVSFAGTAFLQCPLTLDDNAFRQSVAAISPDVMPQGGTALAETIEVAQEAFKNEEENYKILVLITDGEDHEQLVLDAGKEAEKDGMRIFTLGVGSAEGDLIPVGKRGTKTEYLKDENGQVVRSRMNEALLQQLAGVANGFYLNLSGAQAIETLYAQGLAPLPRGEISSRLIRRYFERFYWPLSVAIVLLLIEMFLPDKRRRRKQKSSPTTAVAALIILLCLTPSAAEAVSAGEANRKFRDGDYAGAQEVYEELRKESPDDHRLSFNAGTAAYRAGDYEAAARNFSAAVAAENIPLQRQAWYNLGNTLVQAGQSESAPEKTLESWESAVRMYDQALKLEENAEDANFNKNLVTKMIKQLKEQMQQQESQDGSDEDDKEDKDDKEDGEDDQEDQQNKDQKQDGENDEKQDDQKQDQQNEQSQENQDEKKEQSGENKQQDEQSGDAGKEDDEKRNPEEKEENPSSKPEPGEEKEDGEKQKGQAPRMVKLTPEQAKQLLDAHKSKERTLIFSPAKKDKKGERKTIVKTW